MAELAGEAQEGLLALALVEGTGLQVMAAMMEADVTAQILDWPVVLRRPEP